MAKTKPKDIGTQAETDVVQWAKKHGFYRATRRVLEGVNDKGDVLITESIMAQVKAGYTAKKTNDNGNTLSRAEPTDFLIGKWLAGAEKQAHRGGYPVWFLVHKRFGKADPDNWRWYTTGQIFMDLMGKGNVEPGSPPPYVQLQGYMVPPLLTAWTVR